MIAGRCLDFISNVLHMGTDDDLHEIPLGNHAANTIDLPKSFSIHQGKVPDHQAEPGSAIGDFLKIFMPPRARRIWSESSLKVTGWSGIGVSSS